MVWEWNERKAVKEKLLKRWFEELHKSSGELAGRLGTKVQMVGYWQGATVPDPPYARKMAELLRELEAPNGGDTSDAPLVPEVTPESEQRQQTTANPDFTKPFVNEAVQYLNIILAGVPGTGKTYAYKGLCEALGATSLGAITFHPNTAYEDFVEGIRPASRASAPQVPAGPPELIGDRETEPATDLRFFDLGAYHAPTPGSWRPVPGFFVSACIKACREPAKKFAVLIDEINRANVPKVLGDLLTTLERTKRAKPKAQDGKNIWDTTGSEVVELPMSGLKFFVPENLYVVATMNTTDRSVTPLDVALRRRFAYLRVDPLGGGKLTEALEAKAPARQYPHLRAELDLAAETITKLNETIIAHPELGPDAQIGHSYLFDVVDRFVGNDPAPDDARTACALMWQFAIFPQVFETFRAFGRGDLFDFGGKGTSRSKNDSLVLEAIRFVAARGHNFHFKYVAGMMESLTIFHPLTAPA